MDYEAQYAFEPMRLSPSKQTEADDSMDHRLQEAQRMEAMGLLACGLVHDFNNALSVMIGQAEMLRLQFSDAESCVRLEKIVQTGRRAAGLVAQIMQGMQQNKREIRPLLLAPLLKEAVKLLAAAYRDQIRFQVGEMDRTLTAQIAAVEFHQILFNLCMNAADAMDLQGVVKIALRRAYRPESVIPWVYLEVRDHGSGIDENLREKIFSPFFTTKSSGTGVGLSMVARIVEARDGLVEMESDGKTGAVFRVWLPAGSRQEVEESISGPYAVGRGQVVAIVDSSTEAADVTSQLLEAGGYRTRVFLSSRALEYALREEEAAFDLLLLSVGQASLQVPAPIRSIAPDLPVLILSSCPEDFSQRIQNLPVLRKPFSFRELMLAVSELTGRG